MRGTPDSAGGRVILSDKNEAVLASRGEQSAAVARPRPPFLHSDSVSPSYNSMLSRLVIPGGAGRPVGPAGGRASVILFSTLVSSLSAQDGKKKVMSFFFLPTTASFLRRCGDGPAGPSQ